MNRGFYKICCICCRLLHCFWEYNDTQFAPTDISLGDLQGDDANAEGGRLTGKVIWLRAGLCSESERMQLFQDTIDASDICQGALGNCWLLAAVACLAEHPGAIQSVFKSKERNPRGKYRLRLYDGLRGTWESIVIDDMIPCDKDMYWKDGHCRPVFSKPHRNELYVMLLEKAFAKFCGSYAATEGGHTIWAIRAMTGDPARLFRQNNDKTGWTRTDLINAEDGTNRRACKFEDRGEEIDNSTMFEVLLKYHKLKSVLCASGSSGVDGLHTGHAYSILDVRKVNASFPSFSGKAFQLVQLRNPWGSGEWSGDWSDRSDLWNQHPKVANAIKNEDANDGSFWMSWDDYIKNWTRIGVVDRTVDINTMRLFVKGDTWFAPIVGCCQGCWYFWCCCTGAKRLYCPHRSSEDTVKVNTSYCSIL